MARDEFCSRRRRPDAGLFEAVYAASKAFMDDTKVGASHKDDPAVVAKQGFEALIKDKDDGIERSLKTKIQGALSKVLPDTVNAQQCKLSEPGSADN